MATTKRKKKKHASTTTKKKSVFKKSLSSSTKKLSTKKKEKKPEPNVTIIKVPIRRKRSRKKQLEDAMLVVPVRKGNYSKKDLKFFKEIILEKKQEVLEDIERERDTVIDPTTGEYMQGSSLYSLHMEHGTDSMEREKAFLMVSREAKFLNNLNEALNRIEHGNYGWCKDCGNLIEKKRLEAVPHAQLCADCKKRRGGTPHES